MTMRVLEFAVRASRLKPVDRLAVSNDIQRCLKRAWCLTYIAPWVWLVG